MNGVAVVKRYARALFEVATEKRAVFDVAEDMAAMERLMKEAPAIRDYCLERRTNRREELRFIETAFIPLVGAYTAETLRIAVRNGRIAALPYLPEAFREAREKAAGMVHVVLETAHEPDQDLLDRIEENMNARIGPPVTMEVRIVPELLGGLRLSWNNRVLDLSAAGRLKALRAWVLQGRTRREPV